MRITQSTSVGGLNPDWFIDCEARELAGTTWSVEDTRALLNLWGDYREQQQLEGSWKLASLLKRDFKTCILLKLLGKWFTRLQFSPVQPDHFRWEEQKKAIWLRETNEEYSLAESRPCSLMRYSGSK